MDQSAEWLPDPARRAALAEFAAGAGHEINNPLATIIGRAQQLLREEADPQRRQSLATIAAQAYRIRDMIGDVMLFARPPQPEKQSFDAIAACRQVIDRLAEPLAQSKCRAVMNAIPQTSEVFPDFGSLTDGANTSEVSEDFGSLKLCADPAQFAVVVSELVRNAMTALQPTGGEIRIDFAATESGVSVAVTDLGRGFSDLEREHAFDPFFSGRQAGRGLGFGLCKVARIVDQHGGRITILSSPGGPTTVTTFWA